ncbi:hypothetical protein GCM10010508_61820 [Streptomyces naganishii JCM 4654]|uniref:Uncharacterized protein n=1 Tax=Streptomyces naganishii JCM 4654 TaxID=1306179 RepID=A0A919CYK8_9ACTN|nr:hypothetical protein GCM10010508_61820 [Streptomyces naganishii JCM 4654]
MRDRIRADRQVRGGSTGRAWWEVRGTGRRVLHRKLLQALTGNYVVHGESGGTEYALGIHVIYTYVPVVI